jgi:hypothetical protein
VKPRISVFTAAALQRAGENIAAHGGDGDRPPAHGAGIVDQQGDDGVAEIRLALPLVGEREHRVDDDARQARGIEHALLQVELPGALLLRQQAALQPVGELGDHALQVLSCWSSCWRSRASSSASQRSSASTTSSNCFVKAL